MKNGGPEWFWQFWHNNDGEKQCHQNFFETLGAVLNLSANQHSQMSPISLSDGRLAVHYWLAGNKEVKTTLMSLEFTLIFYIKANSG